MNKTVLALAVSFTWAGMAFAQMPAPTPAAPPLETPPPVWAPTVGNPQVTTPEAAPMGAAPMIAATSAATAAPMAAPVPTPMPATAWARVLSVTTMAQPYGNRVVCNEAEVPAPTSGAGAVAGALVGAAVGSQVGGGAGTALATAAGFVGGAMVGEKAEQGGRTQAVRQCVTQAGPGVAYQVVYEYAGQQYSAVMPYHPGATMQVHLGPVPTSVGVVGAAPAFYPVPVVVSPAVYGAPPAVVVGVGRGWGRPHHGGWGWRGGHRHWRY